MNDLIELPSGTTLEAAKQESDISSLIHDYNEFIESDRDMGKTAKLWFSYTDHVWLILNMIISKYKDYSLYCHTLFRMADLFFSFDGQNYARYLTSFAVFLANIDESHPGARALLEEGASSSSLSGTDAL